MRLSIDQAVTRNLPPNVDVIWNRQHPTRVLGNEIIQVQPASFLSPNKRVLDPSTGLEAKGANNLAKDIDCTEPTEYPWRRSQILHAFSLRPQKWIFRRRTVAACCRFPYNLAEVIDGVRAAEAAAECAQVLHTVGLGPKKSVVSGEVVNGGNPNDLTEAVDGCRLAVGTAERT